MANEKVLNTRIINKHADLATWNASTLPLKTGEIALARIETTRPDGHGGSYTIPTYLMKVGDGNKTFSELEWLAAPASDVYSWAKAEKKPDYTATEITRDGSTVEADLKAAEEAITALQSAVGDGGSVEDMIKAAIEALDVDDAAVANQFVTAVAEADGKISVTRRALAANDIPTLGIDKIDGLQAALNLKADKTYVDEQDNAIKATIGSTGDAAGTATVYGAIATAKKAGDDAQSYAEGVNTEFGTYKTNNDARVKAIEDDYTTAAEAGTIAQGKVDTFNTTVVTPLAERVTNAETAVSTLKGGETTATVKANAEAIAKLAEDIGNVANVMNFVGVSTTDPDSDGGATINGTPYTGVSGDVIIYAEKEYVFDGSDWVKFGDASDSSTAISDLQDRVGTVETRLNTGDIHEAITAAKTQADQGVANAAAAQSKADANETAIGVINGSGDGSIAKALADAKTYAEGKASEAQTAAVSASNTYTDGEIEKVEESVTNLTTTVNNNATTAANATKAVADDLADYKTSNNAAVEAAAAKGQQGIDDAANALQAVTDLEDGQVKTNKEDIAAIKTDVEEIEANFAKVKTTTTDGVTTNTLVVGADEDVIIFDCGGAV